jgi:hypothetical protein
MVALTAALAACSSPARHGAAADGPLSGGGFGSSSGGGDCGPARVGQAQAFGDERFTNHGRATLVLDRVTLLSPHHERLIGSYAVPGDYLIGLVYWPPQRADYAGLPLTWKAWEHRRPVAGFRLAPGESFNLVFGVVATARGLATSPGAAIYYHDPAGSFVLRNHFAMQITVGNAARC